MSIFTHPEFSQFLEAQQYSMGIFTWILANLSFQNLQQVKKQLNIIEPFKQMHFIEDQVIFIVVQEQNVSQTLDIIQQMSSNKRQIILLTDSIQFIKQNDLIISQLNYSSYVQKIAKSMCQQVYTVLSEKDGEEYDLPTLPQYFKIFINQQQQYSTQYQALQLQTSNIQLLPRLLQLFIGQKPQDSDIQQLLQQEINFYGIYPQSDILAQEIPDIPSQQLLSQQSIPENIDYEKIFFSNTAQSLLPLNETPTKLSSKKVINLFKK
ncbi:hypothetical protein SS50377_27410 [Spironucleus salmonicida]|uniref:Uncharacterized protein n=1 Tax=Spironucleus salmonicida TaxID=348837 RepID=V6LFI2_9EUKA|nr:hypothetical protein SS50377_27410 [Spironucleus salmonicida]|eukprot:EST43300.1 Hypothetical protein SS50377_16967 [Spironucleus salmonicida]